MKKTNKYKKGSEKIPFFPSESAAATAIGAVLLLGIIFSIFAVIWLYYVPEWKSDAESSHMDDVYEDMANIKSNIDLMSIVLASNSSYINSSNQSPSFPYPMMSVPFHMGGGDIPVIGSIKSSGSLAVNRDNCTMDILVNGSTNPIHLGCGTITYNSQNRYYMDQDFSYECGALILDQNGQSVMTLYPSICFSGTQTDGYNVSINTVTISPSDLPRTISSNKGCSLRLTGIDYKPRYDSDIDGNVSYFTLKINTKHPNAWEQYLKKATGYEQSIINDHDHLVSLNFTSSENLKRLYVSETNIKARTWNRIKLNSIKRKVRENLRME